MSIGKIGSTEIGSVPSFWATNPAIRSEIPSAATARATSGEVRSGRKTSK